MIPERISRLREEMKKRNIAVYIVPTADFHESEYVGEYFKARKYITGFSGSAGTAVITMTEAGLWTDGRYFVQAAAQLRDTGVTLYKMGNEGVPTIAQYLRNTLKEGDILGFDGRVVNGSTAETYIRICEEKGASLAVGEDLIDRIWEDRPEMSAEPAWILKKAFAGKAAADKLKNIRAEMAEKGCSHLLISSLCDIAWILNIRGNDISYVPVVLSFLAVEPEKAILFVQEKALSDEVRAYLNGFGVEIRPYEAVYEYTPEIPAGSRLWICREGLNYRLCSLVPSGVEVFDAPLPSELMKAMKNETEVKNIRIAHEKDAVAMIEFMYWLKKNVGKIPMTEISVSDHLAELRAAQDDFVDLSFETICGYAEHGAIVHYSATPETDKEIKPESLLLVDSGGHYLQGTTDITRTFALGPVTDEMKADFTRVLRSNMNLAHSRFRYGCTGLNLDIKTREPFWEVNQDYNHGTGHGVGYLLNVHEGPQGFRWKPVPGKSEQATLEEGMVITDEPGLYLEGKYGIRTENEMLVRRGKKNEYGQFMYFETITYVPVDLDAIDPDQLSVQEKKWLNDYHREIYEKMASRLPAEIAEWLKEYTREI